MRLKYTKKEAIELGKRNFRYNALCAVGLEETADIFWDSWHNKPENEFLKTALNRSRRYRKCHSSQAARP